MVEGREVGLVRHVGVADPAQEVLRHLVVQDVVHEASTRHHEDHALVRHNAVGRSEIVVPARCPVSAAKNKTKTDQIN